jgi:hypothetical protein
MSTLRYFLAKNVIIRIAHMLRIPANLVGKCSTGELGADARASEYGPATDHFEKRNKLPVVL